MAQPIYQVDAFTDKPFSGNPAGVCILPKKVSEEWMKAVAREMNLSETAFLLQVEDAGQENKSDKDRMAEDTQVGKISQAGKGQTVFSLRWFTPMTEVDLCGHATLASAHILWETGRLLPNQQARFHTRSGMITADQRGDWIEMNFPSKPEQPATIPIDFPSVLGAQPKYVGRNQFDYLVEVDNEDSSARHETRLFPPGQNACAGGDRHLPARRTRKVRFRLTFLCPGGGRERGSGDRLGARLPGLVLGQAPGQDRDDRLPGLGPRRGGESSPGWRPRIPVRAGGYGNQGRDHF